MKAFVTGASGHVGCNLVRQLLDEGHSVRCLVRSDRRALQGLNVELVEADLLNSEELIDVMDDIDVVFHAAAYVAVESVDEPLMWEINVEGTRAVCEAALKSEVKKMVFFSSVHAFSQHPTEEPLEENRKLVSENSKTSPYDRTKAAAQRVVYSFVEKGLDASVIHPTGIIGPNDWKPSRMGQVIIDIANGKMPIALNTGFDWVDVRDVCSTAITCAKIGRPGQNYLTPGHWVSFPDLSKIIERHLNKKLVYASLPLVVAYTALPFAWLNSKITGQRPSFSRGSLHALNVQCREIPGHLATKELGHSNYSIQETIIETLTWMQEQGQI